MLLTLNNMIVNRSATKYWNSCPLVLQQLRQQRHSTDITEPDHPDSITLRLLRLACMRPTHLYDVVTMVTILADGRLTVYVRVAAEDCAGRRHSGCIRTTHISMECEESSIKKDCKRRSGKEQIGGGNMTIFRRNVRTGVFRLLPRACQLLSSVFI